MYESDWTELYRSSDVYKVELLKVLLLNHDVAAVVINKNDSAYRVIGEAHLYVPKMMEPMARNIMKEEIPKLDDQNFDFSLN